MFPRSREVRRVILLAARRREPDRRGRARGRQNGSLAKVFRGSIGLQRCASTARVLGIKCSRNGDKSSSAEIPNNATAPCAAAKRRARRSAARLD